MLREYLASNASFGIFKNAGFSKDPLRIKKLREV